jgi:arylsulfatase A-like enzyme
LSADEHFVLGEKPPVVAGVIACSVALLFGLLASGSEPTRAASAPGSPNILLIITDDQRLGSVVAGGESYGTPGRIGGMPSTLLEFEAGGQRFRRAFVTTPLCCPSRASIYSGKYAHNHAVVTNHGEGFDADHSWQRYLHDTGYLTGIAGKYLNGAPASEAPHFDFAREWGQDEPADDQLAANAGDEFLTLSEADDARPWALVIAPHSPHKPYAVEHIDLKNLGLPPFKPPASFEEEDLSDKHPSVRAAAGTYEPVDPPRVFMQQMNELGNVDEMIESVFSQLRALGEEENTLAFFISDNGFLLGDHMLMSKGWPYRRSVQVPFYARWPGHIPAGTESNSIVANIDIAPTIYEATGVTPGYQPDGRSLLSPSGRNRILLELPAGWLDVPPWTALWRPKRYYVEWSDGFVESYDLSADPDQMEASNVVDPKLETILDNLRSCAGASCP